MQLLAGIVTVLSVAGFTSTACSQATFTKSVGSCRIDPMPPSSGDVAAGTSMAVPPGVTTVLVDDIGEGGVVNVAGKHACLIVQGDIGAHAQAAVDGEEATLLVLGRDIDPTAYWGATGTNSYVSLRNYDKVRYAEIQQGRITGTHSVVLQDCEIVD